MDLTTTHHFRIDAPHLMHSKSLPDITSFKTLKVYLPGDRALEKLVLHQLDVLLDVPTTSPMLVCSTAPLRIHRVYEATVADIELVYDTETRTLAVSPRETPDVAFEGMGRFPLTFSESSLRPRCQPCGMGKTLPPFPEYIYNAARAFALLKHATERDGPYDMRSEVGFWIQPLVQGPGTPTFLPSGSKEMVPPESLDVYMLDRGSDITTVDVHPDKGYGIVAYNCNPNGLYVAVVKIPSISLKPGKSRYACPSRSHIALTHFLRDLFSCSHTRRRRRGRAL